MKMKPFITASLSLCLIAASAPIAQAAVLVYTPDTLAELQTSGDVLYADNGVTGSSTVQDPSVESPNELRFYTTIANAANKTYTHNIVGASIDPGSDGAITDVDFTIDVADPNLGDSDTIIYFGLTQGGNTYLYAESASSAFRFRNAGSTSFATIAKSNLIASDFALFTGTGFETVNDATNPDFSGSGGTIQFLLATFSSTGDSTLERYTDIRNTSLTVTTIPEPSTALMLGILGGLFLLRRHRCESLPSSTHRSSLLG